MAHKSSVPPLTLGWGTKGRHFETNQGSSWKESESRRAVQADLWKKKAKKAAFGFLIQTWSQSNVSQFTLKTENIANTCSSISECGGSES